LARHPEEISPECEECEGEGKVPPVDDDGCPTVTCTTCDGDGQDDDARRYETAEEVGFRLDPIPHYNRGRTRIEPKR
jgi:DnaJ-class molecular chaperone